MILFVPEELPGDITKLQQQAIGADQSAREQAISLVYKELHRLASRVIRGESEEHTL